MKLGRNLTPFICPKANAVLLDKGAYGIVRHPIYALSIMLMFCTVVVVLTVPVVVMAAIHIVLMIIKARNEERFLASVHGAAYEQYCRRTGRFFPRLAGAAAASSEVR